MSSLGTLAIFQAGTIKSRPVLLTDPRALEEKPLQLFPNTPVFLKFPVLIDVNVLKYSDIWNH